MTGIIIATAVVGLSGLIIGLLLGIAGDKFSVEVDEKEVAVRECLPGNNCGACGFAGCDGLAASIAKGEAPVNGCPVGGQPVADEVAKIMGVESAHSDRQVAYVKCAGTCDKASQKANYYGLKDCKTALFAPGGSGKACSYGCTGFGTCVKACEFDAIHVVNGVAVVDKEACVACGKCINSCPKHLIEFIPYKATTVVGCNSNAKGKDVKAVCQAGCIGCTLCTKVCESEAITVMNNLAHIDQSKCTGCGKCVEKCPVKVIELLA